jgi:hypothetical protein
LVYATILFFIISLTAEIAQLLVLLIYFVLEYENLSPSSPTLATAKPEIL